MRRAPRASGRARAARLTTARVAPTSTRAPSSFASRGAGEDWFCFEQPDRDGVRARRARRRHAADGLRAPIASSASPPTWRELDRAAPWPTRPTARPAPGSSRVGGFAFAPDGGHAPHWAGFDAADLIVPEVALARRGDDVRLTLAALAAPDDVPEELAARLAARAAALRPGAAAAARPGARPAASAIDSVAPPEHYEAAVARAVERIRAGAFEKIVLAREVTVHAPTPHDAAAVFGVLRAGFESCYVFCAGRGDAAFVAASPELLIRRDGQRAQTVALAGSTRRSADPAVDDHLGEQLLQLRQGPRGAGDRRPPHRPRAAPARRLGRRARRARP